MSAYHQYGIQHGTALFYDCSKPDVDAFLAYMEKRLPAHGLQDYIDGVIDAVNGEHKRKFRQLRGLMKEGSEA